MLQQGKYHHAQKRVGKIDLATETLVATASANIIKKENS